MAHFKYKLPNFDFFEFQGLQKIEGGPIVSSGTDPKGGSPRLSFFPNAYLEQRRTLGDARGCSRIPNVNIGDAKNGFASPINFPNQEIVHENCQ